MGYKELIEALKSMLPEKVLYGDLIGAEGVYAHSGPLVYEDPEPYFIEQAITAINDLLARAEEAEGREKNLIEAVQMITARAEKAEEIASDLCDDFTDFVTGGVPNAAPYCENYRPECVDGRGWCDGDNRVCKGFLPKAARQKEK